jgi:hypothetical protein
LNANKDDDDEDDGAFVISEERWLRTFDKMVLRRRILLNREK